MNAGRQISRNITKKTGESATAGFQTEEKTGSFGTVNEKTFVTNSARNSQQQDPKSRYEIMKDLEKLGIDVSPLSNMSIEVLETFLKGFRHIVDSYQQQRMAGRSKSNDHGSTSNDGIITVLSDLDKRVLRQMVTSKGHVSSLTLSRELGIPLTTVQRRRKGLEDKLVERNYFLKVEKLGWRRAILLLSIDSGAANRLGAEILEMADEVESVHRMLGDNTVDLKAEVVFKTNSELISLIDKIKSKEGVKNVLWSEPIELIGRSQNTFKKIIDSL